MSEHVYDDGDLPDMLRPALNRDPTASETRLRRPRLVMARASDIRPEAIRWLWPHRIAIGKQTLLAGEPGLGKSQLTCWITATVTTGGRWPDSREPAPPGSVIILSAEDDAADTIRPRLEKALIVSMLSIFGSGTGYLISPRLPSPWHAAQRRPP